MDEDINELKELLSTAIEALADIAYANDLTEAARRNKADRVHKEIRNKLGDRYPDV